MPSTILTPLLAFLIGVILTALIYRRTRVVVNLPEVAVTLPDSLRVILQQPAPPAAPMDRGRLWQEVYDSTLSAQGDPAYESDVNRAITAANQAVANAFPA